MTIHTGNTAVVASASAAVFAQMLIDLRLFQALSAIVADEIYHFGSPSGRLKSGNIFIDK
jgi:hypothetical protein